MSQIRSGSWEPDTPFWRKWENHYRKLGLGDAYCADGIADPAVYENAEPRLLFVLKEPNKWKRAHVRSQLNEGAKYLVWRNLARWAVGILDGFPPLDEIGQERLDRALRQIAVINLKKASGGARSHSVVLAAFAHLDRDLLRRQVDEITPDLVIACGEDVFSNLIWLLNLDADPRTAGEEPVRSRRLDLTSVCWKHPSSRAKTEDLYRGLQDRVSDWNR